jgi:hypothetical protein
MIWEFKQNKNSIKVTTGCSEAGTKYSLGNVPNTINLTLVSLAKHFSPGDIIKLKGITETIVYKSVKSNRTLTKPWHHHNVIFGGVQGLPNN